MLTWFKLKIKNLPILNFPAHDNRPNIMILEKARQKNVNQNSIHK